MKNFNLSFHLNKFDRNPAIIFPGGKLNYRQYSEKIRQVAANLLKCKIKAGDYIAVLSENNWQYVVLILALIQIKAVAVPLNIRYPNKRLLEILIEIKCKKVFISNKFKKINFKQINSVLDIDEIFADEFSADEYNNNLEINYDQPVTILFTSGSNGKPKAVLHTFGNHYYSALGSNENIKLTTGDKWLVTLPLYHVGGLAIIFRAFLSGAAVCFPQKESSIIDNIKENQTSHISFVATQLIRLLEDKSNLKYLAVMKAILLGGGFIPEYIIKQSKQAGLPIFCSYGSTEMSSQITTTQKGDSKIKLFTSGKILKYRNLKISKKGEILVKGKTLFQGYLKNGKLKTASKKNGWFASGDLGSIDQNGYLTVLGRKDNMFISGGENIYPEEIERILYLYPGVEQAFVIPVNDIEFGKRPVCFLQMHYNKKVDMVKLKKLLNNNLPRYMIPVKYLEMQDLEKSGIKTDRKYLIELAEKKVKMNFLSKILKYNKLNFY